MEQPKKNTNNCSVFFLGSFGGDKLMLCIRDWYLVVFCWRDSFLGGRRGGFLRNWLVRSIKARPLPMRIPVDLCFDKLYDGFYPNYSHLTRPHPKWQGSRGTSTQMALLQKKSGWWKYYKLPRWVLISPQISYRLVLLLPCSLGNCFFLSFRT